MTLFYALCDINDPDEIAFVSGPQESLEQALENATEDCCTGEPGDPVFHACNAVETEPGRYECEGRGEHGSETAIILIADNPDKFE